MAYPNLLAQRAPFSRVTALDGTGAPLTRWTLEAADRTDGRSVSWTPEGALTVLGAANAFRRVWSQRGFRLALKLHWAGGISSTREDFSAGAWGAPVRLTSALAHGQLLQAAGQGPVLVEPFCGSAMVAPFLGRASETGWTLQDQDGAVHVRLALVLNSIGLVDLGWGFGPWGYLAWGD